MTGSITIDNVVNSGLCTSCGTCVSICPVGAIYMKETPPGFLIAQTHHALCVGCKLCTNICPGSHLEEKLLAKEIDPFKGHVVAAYSGYAVEPDIRCNAQSGGIATALSAYLLDTECIKKVLVTHMPEDGSLRPVPFFAENKKQLMKTQGSKYCPVAVNSILPTKIKDDEIIAVVGTPCQIHGVRNAQKYNETWKKQILLTIGLFCDRILVYGAIDYLIHKAGVQLDKVALFEFRNTAKTGWPGSVCIQEKEGDEHLLLSKYRMECKDLYTPLRCRLCFDKTNVLSDIVLGDAWGVKHDARGFSSIIVRTKKGLEILKNAEKAGYICLEKVKPELIFQGQGVEKRRLQWSNYTAVSKEKGIKVPDYSFSSKFKIDAEKGAAIKPVKKQLNWAVNLSLMNSRRKVLASVNKHLKYKKIVREILLGGIKEIIKRIKSPLK